MLYDITVESILRAVLVFIRVGAVLFALPIIGDQPTPVRVRILLSIAMAFAIQGIIPDNWLTRLPEDVLEYFIMALKEACIGVLLGFVARMAFDSIVMAGSLVGFQMGFGVADLMIPDAQMQMSAFSALHRIILVMIFLCLNLHHMYFDAIVRTFSMIPAGGIFPHRELGGYMIRMSSDLFRIAMQLSAPMLVALLFTNTALGLIARTVPQLNVFSMSFPLGFFVGLLIYLSCLPFLPGWASEHFHNSELQILQTLKGLSP